MVPVGAAACGGAAGREGWAAARGTQCLRPTTPLSQTPPHSARRGDERRAASGDGDVRGAESSPARPAPDHAAARAASRCASRCLFTPLVHTSCSRLPLRLSLRLPPESRARCDRPRRASPAPRARPARSDLDAAALATGRGRLPPPVCPPPLERDLWDVPQDMSWTCRGHACPPPLERDLWDVPQDMSWTCRGHACPPPLERDRPSG